MSCMHNKTKKGKHYFPNLNLYKPQLFNKKCMHIFNNIITVLIIIGKHFVHNLCPPTQ